MRFRRALARMRAHDPSTSPDAERAVTRSAQSLVGALDVASTLRGVVASAREALGGQRATCYAVWEGALVTAVHTTEADPRRRARLEATLGESPLGIPMWQRHTASADPVLSVEEVPAATPLPHPDALAASLGMRAYLGVRLEHPLLLDGDAPAVLGTISCSWARPRPISVHDRAVLQGLANLAALALAHHRAATDPLTGLPDHRGFRERLAVEVDDAHRHGRELSLLVLGLDPAVTVSDRHAHAGEDHVVVEAARRLAGEARPADLLARVGRARFALVLPMTDAPGAWGMAERARAAIGGEAFAAAGRLTASAGLCDIHQATSARELHGRAEAALSWAMSHGRDTTVRYAVGVEPAPPVPPAPAAEAPARRRATARHEDEPG